MRIIISFALASLLLLNVMAQNAQATRVRHGETALRRVELLPHDSVSPLFLACVEATEKAVYNSLLRATTMKGRNGTRVEALPIDETMRVLKKYNALRGGP